MKKPMVMLFLAVLAPTAALAQSQWTGAVSTQWDLGGNWSAGLPYQGTANAQLEGWGAGYTNVQPAFGWPVIDSNINTYWGIGRVRGPGPHLTQTGGMHEWPNGSGRSSRGITIYSRPGNEFPPSVGSPNDPAHPCLVRLTGGTHITDGLGLGVTGGLNSGCYYTTGRWGDYAEDTGAYRNWQLAEGDNRYGWGRLEIAGTATFIVRPNRYVYPAGYEEITPYWEFYSTNAPTEDYPCRIHDIAIGTNSQLVISDFGKLIAPYKLFTNSPIAEYYKDRDLVTQLQYYAGLVQAGASPHYVQNGALSGPRLVAGPGQTLQFDLFPAGTNDVNEPYGGYFTVTAVPAPVEVAILSVGSLSIKGLVGRQYQIQSKDDLKTAGWDVRTNFTLTASPATWNDPSPSSTNRFYRAALLPLP
jgi:hypothetical protein